MLAAFAGKTIPAVFAGKTILAVFAGKTILAFSPARRFFVLAGTMIL
jgi:hypothetical protein